MKSNRSSMILMVIVTAFSGDLVSMDVKLWNKWNYDTSLMDDRELRSERALSLRGVLKGHSTNGAFQEREILEFEYNEKDQSELYKRWIYSCTGIESIKNNSELLFVFVNDEKSEQCIKNNRLNYRELGVSGFLRDGNNFLYPIRHDAYKNRKWIEQKLDDKVNMINSADENEEWNDPIHAFFRRINKEQNRTWALQQLKNHIGYTQPKKRFRHKKKLWGNNYHKISYKDRLKHT